MHVDSASHYLRDVSTGEPWEPRARLAARSARCICPASSRLFASLGPALTQPRTLTPTRLFHVSRRRRRRHSTLSLLPTLLPLLPLPLPRLLSRPLPQRLPYRHSHASRQLLEFARELRLWLLPLFQGCQLAPVLLLPHAHAIACLRAALATIAISPRPAMSCSFKLPLSALKRPPRPWLAKLHTQFLPACLSTISETCPPVQLTSMPPLAPAPVLLPYWTLQLPSGNALHNPNPNPNPTQPRPDHDTYHPSNVPDCTYTLLVHYIHALTYTRPITATLGQGAFRWGAGLPLCRLLLHCCHSAGAASDLPHWPASPLLPLAAHLSFMQVAS